MQKNVVAMSLDAKCDDFRVLVNRNVVSSMQPA